jgi:hypothetical protein
LHQGVSCCLAELHLLLVLLLPTTLMLQADNVVAADAVPALVQLLASQRRSCQVMPAFCTAYAHSSAHGELQALNALAVGMLLHQPFFKLLQGSNSL